jgi:hypothetical protein
VKQVSSRHCILMMQQSGGGAPIRRVPELPLVEVGVATACGQQHAVAAALDDLARLDDQDQIGVPDRAQAVGDDDARASTQQPPERWAVGRLRREGRGSGV